MRHARVIRVSHCDEAKLTADCEHRPVLAQYGAKQLVDACLPRDFYPPG